MNMIPKQFVEYVYAELTQADHLLIKQKVEAGQDFDDAMDEVRKIVGFKDTRTGKFYPKKQSTSKPAIIKSDDEAGEVDIGETDLGGAGLDNYDIDFDNEYGFSDNNNGFNIE